MESLPVDRRDSRADSGRPIVARRATYTPEWPSEAFIVPLLRALIDEGLSRYAVPARSGARALDVGCGAQPFRAALEKLGYAYVGLDAQQNAAGSVDVVAVIDAPLPSKLIERAPFDFILCTEVLEHVAQWGTAFGNLARLLAPGGRVLVTCPHFYIPHEEPYDFWRPTPHALSRFASDAGLRALELRGVGDAWDVLGTLLAVTQVWPAKRRRLLDRLLAAAVRLQCRAAHAALRSGRLQRRVRAGGPCYLSVFGVFEKTG